MNHRPRRPLLLTSTVLALLACAALALGSCQPGDFTQALPSAVPPAARAAGTQPSGPLSTPLFGPLLDPLLRLLYTPTPTLTPTPSETPIPARTAVLFPVNDLDGTRITWGYERVTELRWDQNGKTTDLWAFLSFQLMDRGIHRYTIQVLGKDLTVYYLNAQHEFNGQMRPVRVIIDGEWGTDVPLNAIVSPSSFFIPARVLSPGERFDPNNIHLQSVKNYADALPDYQGGMQLVDFERALAAQPDALILLADGPVRADPSTYTDIDYYFRQVPFLAARYWPLAALDPLQKVKGPSPYAWALVDHLLKSAPLPDQGIPDPLTYSSSFLVLLPGSQP